MSVENTTTNIQHSTGTESNFSEADVQRPFNFPQQEKEKEIQMAEIDTTMLAGQHADIRRETAIAAGDINRNVSFEGQENMMATKDARSDIIAATENQTDRVVDRVEEAKDLSTAHAFTIARDTADLRAQVIQAIDTTKLATELNALKGIIEGQRNTQYLADRITADGEKTRDLISDLKYHDLNRGLVERNAALVELEGDRRHWRHQAEQNQFAGQWAALQSQVQAFASQLQETRQGVTNFGSMTGNAGRQTSTSNNA